MRVATVIAGVLVLLVLLALGGAAYVVDETEQVILTMFGKPVFDPVTSPGLHWKVPFFHRVHRFDKRFLEWDGDANQLTTGDKRFIFVDTFARWRITDPLLFFQRLRNELGGQSRLDDILDGETRNAIANHDLLEVVRSTNREPDHDETALDPEEVFERIEIGREKIRNEILAKAQARTSDLGIEILDVQFKRVNYIEEDQRKVFDRMISERRRIADRYRSEGEGEAARIRGTRERELKRIESEAFREAETIRGRADAEATRIYADAYDQSADSRAFYQFLKTMETLSSTADEKTVLVLSTDGDLYRFLQSPQ